jgi:UDP-glucose 4-epimerase
MNVVLTGSTGWLGRFLAPLLREHGHAVTGLDVAPGPDTQVLGSVHERGAVERAFALAGTVDAVIHAGALHKPDIARHPAQAFIDVNVTGTQRLLDAASAAGASRFVFTSTTSLMISRSIREATRGAAVWLDEDAAPVEPRNIYGATKLAAEALCRVHHLEHGLPCMVLRTSRFFPEDDDTHTDPSGPNLKANEFLHRRLTVEDAARAHLLALQRAPDIGFDVLIVSAPPPFERGDAAALGQDAARLIEARFPGVRGLYAARGWSLPPRIGRVYDPSRAERVLGFRSQTDFAAVLAALRSGAPLPFAHDPAYISPTQQQR